MSDELASSARSSNRFDPAALSTADLMHTLTGRDGVEICDRFFYLRKFKACFVGRELVDVFVSRHNMSRRQAVQAGQRLVAHGLISHVAQEHDFKDDRLFYAVGRPRESTYDDDGRIQLSFEALTDLVQNMRGPAGIAVGRKRRRLICYPECFSGDQAVSWICEHTQTDRDQAVLVGRALLQHNFIRHVFDEHHFVDEREMYRFV